jgi:hypothetical protein
MPACEVLRVKCCKELARLEKLGGFHSDTNELYEYNEILDGFTVFKFNYCPFCGRKLEISKESTSQ